MSQLVKSVLYHLWLSTKLYQRSMSICGGMQEHQIANSSLESYLFIKWWYINKDTQGSMQQNKDMQYYKQQIVNKLKIL